MSRKVLLYFGHVRHNSAALYNFVEFGKVRNQSELNDDELAGYSLRATHQIYLNDLN